MRHTIGYFLLAMGVTVALPSFAQACNKPLLEEYFEHEAWGRFYEIAADDWIDALAAYGLHKGPVRDAANAIADEGPVDIDAIAEEVYCFGLTDEELAEAFALYEGPLGEKVAAAETQATPREERVEIGAGLVKDASPERIALIDSLIEISSNGTEQIIQREEAAAYAFGMAALQAGLFKDQPTIAEIEYVSQAFETGGRAYWRPIARPVIAYTYRDLTDEELETYLAKLRSDNMVRHYTRFHAAASAVTKAVSREMAIRLSKTVDPVPFPRSE